MPSLLSCEISSPNVQSPPRKKFKLSLKLRSKSRKNLTKFVEEDTSVAVDNDKEENLVSNMQENDHVVTDSSTTTSTTTTCSTSVEESVTPPLPFTGLANLGNTCYLNAVLQVLRYCPQFTTSMEKLYEISMKDINNKLDNEDDIIPSTDNMVPKTNLIHSVHKLISDMAVAEDSYSKLGMDAEQVRNRLGYTTLAVQPSDFVKEFSGRCPMFGSYQQHDAQEFLRSFLSIIEDDCSSLCKDNASNSKESNLATLISESQTKVRGGCKYPTNHSDTITKTSADTTKMTSTSDNKQTGIVSKTKTNNHVVTDVTTDNQPCSKCSPNLNAIQWLFEGTLQLQTRCLNCELVRTRYENFQDISVPVQHCKNRETTGEDVLSDDSEDENNDKERDLLWAISRFASVEKLHGDNKYSCDNCKAMVEAEISTFFEKLPQVLTIHLKRFQTSYGQTVYSGNTVTKVTKNVHTPQTLSLKKWHSTTCNVDRSVYKLFGVVMHNGMSSCSGHYLSYVNIKILNMFDIELNTMNNESCVCLNLKTNEQETNIQDKTSPKCEPLRGIEKYFQRIQKRKNVENVTENPSDGHEHDSSQLNGGKNQVENDDELKMEVDETDRSDRWLKFDDAEVQEIYNKDMEDILSATSYSTPYLLFYYRTPST